MHKTMKSILLHQTQPLLPHPYGPCPTSRHPTHLHCSSSPPPSHAGIPITAAADVRTILKLQSPHNYIRVLQVPRHADHALAGSRLLLLDTPGNIHSMSHVLGSSISEATYYDVFATLPPVLPAGPVGILGFGAGTVARLVLERYPCMVVHGWEIDPFVVDVGREYFGVAELERENQGRLFINVGNALDATSREGWFGGVLVDLFSKGRVIPELQETWSWRKIKGCLKRGGRVMVNVGGSCVEAEDGNDGELVMEESLKAMCEIFGDDGVHVLRLGKNDSCLAMTGEFPDVEVWKQGLPVSLRRFVDMWSPIKDL